jgi:hypothetical protein
MISEPRVPLRERASSIAPWTMFETLLFNLVGDACREAGHGDVIFSKRLAITQVMLDAFDAYFNRRTIQ